MKKLLLLLLVSFAFMFVMCAEKQKEEAPKEEETKFTGTFLEVLNKATELVKVEQANAIFAEADATLKKDAMTAADFISWKFIYWIDIKSSVFIEYKDGLFSNITPKPEPILEDYIIREPVEMDLVEAIDLMRKANYDDVIAAANLKRPLFPGSDEPFYIFGSKKFGHIFVGTISKTVTINEFPEEKGEKKK